jgi:hypothetical protein
MHSQKHIINYNLLIFDNKILLLYFILTPFKGIINQSFFAEVLESCAFLFKHMCNYLLLSPLLMCSTDADEPMLSCP